MKAENIIFFNKEGYPHNLVWDTARNIWTGKVMFDPNSSDTYKTLGLYTFERVEPIKIVANIATNSFQLFNDAGARACAGGVDMPIFGLIAVNDSPDFYTKWVHAPNIQNAVSAGDVVQFMGTNSPGFEERTADGSPNLFTVIGYKKDAVLVKGGKNNGSFSQLYNGATAVGSIRTVHCFQFDQKYAAYNPVTTPASIQPGDRFSIVGTRLNEGVYSASDKLVVKQRAVLDIDAADTTLSILMSTFTGFSPKLTLEVTLQNTLPTVYSGGLRVDGPGSTIHFQRKLSNSIPVGSTLKIESQNVFYTITEVDRRGFFARFEETQAVDYNGGTDDNGNTLFVDGQLQHTTNQLSYSTSFVPDQATGRPHAGFTMAQLVAQYKNVLSSYGINAVWDDDSKRMRFETKYAEDYIDLRLLFNNTAIAATENRDVYILPVGQELSNETLDTTSSVYKRVFEFDRGNGEDSIDSYGLRIGVNGRSWWVDMEDDDNSTLEQWVATFGHEAEKLGLHASYDGRYRLTFEAELPNVHGTTSLKLGETAAYTSLHSTAQVFEIQTRTFAVQVNSTTYTVGTLGTVPATLALWVESNKAVLRSSGITVSVAGDTLKFGTLDPERRLHYTVLNKYAKLPGDTSVLVTQFRFEQHTGVVLSSCSVSGVVDFTDLGFSTGQVISLAAPEAANVRTPMYIQYTVIGAADKKLSLSYQGPFWSRAPEKLEMSGAEFLREPRHGEQASGSNPKLLFDWRETHAEPMFLYDFSGQQLPGHEVYREWESSSSTDDFEQYVRKSHPSLMQYVPGRTPLYVGPRPLLAVDGGTHARLNEEPNLDVKLRTSPTHQRTIFDKLSFSLFYTDDDGDITSLPEPLQTFVGYRSLGEGVDKATLYVSLEEERSMSIEPIFIQNSTTVDNEVLFHENGLVEVLNADPSATSFLQNGFAANQLVTVSGVDTTDNRKRATLANNGRTYRILDVRANSLLLDVTDAVVVAESNVKTTTVSNAPYLDGDGIPRTERRVLTVTFKQAPTQIAELLVIGHTEGEDARYKLALENVGRGIKPKDLFIFKEYDISESGVDWIILNRKRKEMLQVQSEIYNYLSSYKSVAAAIDYFGYSDLEFVEYFLNVDQDSKNFGKLFSSELIDLLNRSVPGHTKKNANAEHLPNDKFRKTNLFSLSYRITDLDGNFVEGYNFDEVTTKLFGLQQWLEDNVIPVGSRITDINGKAVAKSNFTVRHNTFGFQHVKTRDGFSPVLCKVQGYKSPVQISETVTRPVPNSTATEQVMVQRINTYNITVKGETSTNVWPDAVHVRITTFGLPEWRPNSWYKPGDSVYSNGAVWVYTNAHASVGKDIIDPTYWSIGQELNPVPVQIVERTMYSAADSVLLTVDKESDPHFKVEVTSFNGYGGVWKEAKTYSVNYGAWPNA